MSVSTPRSSYSSPLRARSQAASRTTVRGHDVGGGEDLAYVPYVLQVSARRAVAQEDPGCVDHREAGADPLVEVDEALRKPEKDLAAVSAHPSPPVL